MWIVYVGFISKIKAYVHWNNLISYNDYSFFFNYAVLFFLVIYKNKNKNNNNLKYLIFGELYATYI